MFFSCIRINISCFCFIGAMGYDAIWHGDVPYNIRRYATFDAMLKSFSPWYVNLFFYCKCFP